MPALSAEHGGTYIGWRTAVEVQIDRAMCERVPGMVAVRVIGSDADRGRSWPALLAPILQALSDLDVIDGPHMAARVTCDWQPEGTQGDLQIDIRQLSPPVVRHRLVVTRGPRQQTAETAA